MLGEPLLHLGRGDEVALVAEFLGRMLDVGVRLVDFPAVGKRFACRAFTRGLLK